MWKAPARISALFLFCLAPFAAAQVSKTTSPALSDTPVPAPARPDPTAASVVLKIPGMERVRVRPDLVYSTVEGTRLAADLYLPPDAARSASPPVVILVAGGAENTKAWEIYTSLSRLFAASGLAAVPFNHRLRYPKRQYEEGAADLLTLIGFLRSNARRLGVDAG